MKKACRACNKPFTPPINNPDQEYGPVCLQMYNIYHEVIDEIFKEGINGIKLDHKKGQNSNQLGGYIDGTEGVPSQIILNVFAEKDPVVLFPHKSKSYKDKILELLLTRHVDSPKEVLYTFLHEVGHHKNFLNKNRPNKYKQALTGWQKGENPQLLSDEEKRSIIDEEISAWNYVEEKLNKIKWSDMEGFQSVKKERIQVYRDIMFPPKAEKIVRKCIICKIEPATTREHPIKKTSLQKVHNGTQSVLIGKQGVKPFLNPDRAIFTNPDLCQKCNSTTSQPYDFAYSSLLDYIDSIKQNYPNPSTKTLNDDKEKIILGAEKNSGISRDIMNEPGDKMSKEWIRFNLQLNNSIVKNADKQILTFKLGEPQKENIKRYLAKSLACFLARQEKNVPEELNEIFFKQRDVSLIKFSVQRMMYKDFKEDIQGNIDLLISKDGKTISYTILNGEFLILVHYGSDTSGYIPQIRNALI